jgi:aconitate hydratase
MVAKQLLFDPFQSRGTFNTGSGEAGIYRLAQLEALGLTRVARLPFSIRVLLESALRNCDGYLVTEDDVRNLAAWNAASPAKVEIPFLPARVVLQDFTGVPCVVDLAAMRAAMKRLGGDPKRINPLIPVDLVIDHSVQVDNFGASDSLQLNVLLEFSRNRERYEFLRWGQKAFDNFRVVPPNVGIVHQVNLEFLAKAVVMRNDSRGPVALPDTLVGTDSHTTMINGLGIVGWGVGGIEAEATMLGQPLYMLLPEVVGFELTGQLPAGATATDLVLVCTEMLRKAGVVNKFVEFFGAGVSSMSLADRATIANMAPEYGATMGFFPIDAETLSYLRRTGRTEAEVQLVERYAKEQHLFRTDGDPAPIYTSTIKLDLGTVVPSLAGPKRPQDRVPLASMQESFRKALHAPIAERGYALDEPASARTATVQDNGHSSVITHGAVVIAAITSCTNTSNPSVMVAAGLLAKKAAARGLKAKPHVKTSLAPGSRVVTDYLHAAGLDRALEQVGFYTVGYGCTTCIGNSGPLPDNVAKAVTEGDLVASAVLSGNRNFEGRVNPLVKANYLASPPLVVAYALAGTTDVDLTKEPIGKGSDGKDVFLKDIWPTRAEVDAAVNAAVKPEMFNKQYGNAFAGNELWNKIATSEGDLFQWQEASTYIQ